MAPPAGVGKGCAGRIGAMSRTPDVVFENGYEASAWRQVQEWEGRPDAALSKVLRTAGRPVGLLTDRLLLRPVLNRNADRLGEGMRSAASALGARADVAGTLRRTSSAVGRPVRDLAELRAVELRTLDELASGLRRRYVAGASMSGGAAGATSALPGGSLLALGALGADVVASTALMLRAIAAYGTQYGRDMTAPQEAQFAVGLLSLGAVAGNASLRRELLEEVHAVGVLLADGAPWAELSRNAHTRALQAVFDKLGVRMTRRKIAQLIPFFGVAAGGTLGAALADHTCTAAAMQYRRRYLLDKYPDLRR